MSKKINSALKDLKKALEAHADVVGGSAVSLKKAQRASAKVAAAAEAYAEAVHAKSGLDSPFITIESPGLEEATMISLTAERDLLQEQLSGPVPVQEAASPDWQEPEPADSHDDSDDDDDDDDSESDSESDDDESDSDSDDDDEPKLVENPTRSSTD